MNRVEPRREDAAATIVLGDGDGAEPEAREGLRHAVVIGGAGYLGSVLARRLLERVPRVTVMDALLFGDEGIRDLLGEPGFSVVRGDLRDIEAIVRTVHDADAVVHLGGLVGDPACAVDEDLTMEINLEATRTIGRASRGLGVRRFVYASSCSVYGASDGLLDEESELAPLSIYGRSKMESERVLLDLASPGFEPVILRFGTFYGLSPRPRFDLIVNMLAAKAVTEGEIVVFGGGQWRPFIHVDDGAEAIVASLLAPAGTVSGQVFNVGADELNHTIGQVAEVVGEIVPGVRIVLQPAAKDEANYRVSFEKIHRDLGFKPQHTLADAILEIRDAIEAGTVAHYLDERYSNVKSMTNGNGAQVLKQGREDVLEIEGVW